MNYQNTKKMQNEIKILIALYIEINSSFSQGNHQKFLALDYQQNNI